MYSDKQIIEMLGGTCRVARLCNVSPSAVSLWMKRGMPALQIMYLGSILEKESCGLVTRKEMFPNNYFILWPELNQERFEDFLKEN
jgi:DNA-binding transcriptional regulator YdaS (Cro superfamily)